MSNWRLDEVAATPHFHVGAVFCFKFLYLRNYVVLQKDGMFLFEFHILM
jgi:hypothetical protein